VRREEVERSIEGGDAGLEVKIFFAGGGDVASEGST
jgi:hypothetical protein